MLPYTAAPDSSSTSSTAAGVQLSDEGLDWKAPVLVLLLLAAGSVTVFKPAIIDILQLRSAVSASTGASTSSTGNGVANASSSGGAGTGRQGNNGGRSAAASAASRAAAVAAAAAAPLPAGDGAAAAGAADDSEWLDDNELRGMGMKQRGAAGARSRARRA